jgi:hypothetical protein
VGHHLQVHQNNVYIWVDNVKYCRIKSPIFTVVNFAFLNFTIFQDAIICVAIFNSNFKYVHYILTLRALFKWRLLLSQVEWVVKVQNFLRQNVKIQIVNITMWT